jgi:hypothetical protein
MRSSFAGTVLLLTCAISGASTCSRTRPQGSEPGGASPGATAAAAPAPAGTVGPLGADCYDTKGARACPPDPTDPTGRKLPAHGGACTLPVCRPCGSEKAPAFRDEAGRPTPGFCICVPKSDDSGRGVFTCYSLDAWRKRTP